MKMWEKAKEKFPDLSKNDFIFETCPSELGMKDIENPKCSKDIYMDTNLCIRCWEREVD